MDWFSSCRPLVALCDSSGPGTPCTSVSFISLSTGEQVCRYPAVGTVMDHGIVASLDVTVKNGAVDTVRRT